MSNHAGSCAEALCFTYFTDRVLAAPDQAKDAAYTAATAANRAASATWNSLEKVTALYTSTRQYYMLDDLIEASAAAKKVCAHSLQPSPLKGLRNGQTPSTGGIAVFGLFGNGR
jgi:hypothetical protein